jgi:hypothetical protein
LRRLTERLELTNDQRRRVNELVRNSQDRVRQLYEPVVPRAQFELRQLRQEIEATLNPAQRERFAAMIRSSRVTRAPGEPPIRPRPDERGERRREAEPPRQRAPAEPGLRPPGQDPSSKPAEPPPR